MNRIDPADAAPATPSSALLKQIANALPDAVAVRDADGRFLGCNEAYAALLGRRPADIAGRSLEELFPAAQAARIRRDDEEVLASGMQAHREETLSGGDGVPLRMAVVRTALRCRREWFSVVVAVARPVAAAPGRGELGGAVLDEDRLALLRGVTPPGHLRNLLAGALEGAGKARRRMAEATDLLVVVAEARALKEASGALGLGAIAQAAERIEQAARAGKRDAELLAQLADRVEEARRALGDKEFP